MLIRLRRCIAADDGVTVVESMMAILVLTVALFGLMGSLIATAHSQLSQRQETSATRVANEHLERQRSRGFDPLKADMLANCPAGSSCATQTVNRNGLQYTINTTLREIEAGDASRWVGVGGVCAPAGCPTGGRPTVMQADTTISWLVKGRTKTVRSSTMVSPTKPDLTKDIKGITIFPDPLIVAPTSPSDTNPAGQPTTDLLLTVELKGLDATTPVSVSWTDDQGAKGPFALATSDAKKWTRTIQRTQIRKAIPVDEESTALELQIEVNIGSGIILRQQQTVRLVRASNPPIFTPRLSASNPYSKTFISPTYVSSPPNPQYYFWIPLLRTGNQNNRGLNTAAVVFSGEVSGMINDDGTTRGTVTATWMEGSQQISAALTWNPSTQTWRREIPINGQKFPIGPTTVNITFTAYRTSDGATGNVTLLVYLQ